MEVSVDKKQKKRGKNLYSFNERQVLETQHRLLAIQLAVRTFWVKQWLH